MPDPIVLEGHALWYYFHSAQQGSGARAGAAAEGRRGRAGGPRRNIERAGPRLAVGAHSTESPGGALPVARFGATTPPQVSLVKRKPVQKAENLCPGNGGREGQRSCCVPAPEACVCVDVRRHNRVNWETPATKQDGSTDDHGTKCQNTAFIETPPQAEGGVRILGKAGKSRGRPCRIYNC